MSTPLVSDFFGRDHDRLDALFRDFQRLKRSDFPKAKEAFAEFKIGLQRHIIWEEDILFPAFEEKTGMKETGPTAVMRTEHRQIKTALEAIHARIIKKDPASDREEAQLLDVLGQHNIKEENILYPAIDNLVQGPDKESIFLRMEKVPPERYEICC